MKILFEGIGAKHSGNLNQWLWSKSEGVSKKYSTTTQHASSTLSSGG